MDTVLGWFKQRPLRLISLFLVFLSVGLLGFLVLLDIVAGLSNPYIGIITYMILPGVLVFGLLLVPIDAWIQRRRVAHGLPEYPVIDLCNPFQRKIAGFFVAASTVILIVMTVASYKAIEFMDTKTFCGKVCHKVMDPEYTAYLRSPHASVACIECHIGPGAPWFVRSKLSGLPQVYHYTKKDYPRPLETPVKALRPSRDTCENCHYPEAFYGSTLKTDVTYREDKNNTQVVSSMFMRVGSGGVSGSGIHSHMVSAIHYLPAVHNRSEIAWVGIERPDGSYEEFVNPTYQDDLPKLRQKEENRVMDCIDCHNRPAHEFTAFQKILDDAITREEVDRSLPFIKHLAVQAVGDAANVPTQAEQDAAVRRVREIPDYYKRTMPEIYNSRTKDIDKSVKAIEHVYLTTTFPHMRVGPDTYPNWRTHVGCFRCHGVLVAANPRSRDKEIPGGCNLCHTQPVSGDPSALIGNH